MKLPSYSYRFIHHISSFIKDAGMPPDKAIVVAVSAGIDSMALLKVFWCFRELKKIKKLTAVHVNHGSRDSCEDEEAFIRSFCKKYEIELVVEKFRMGLNTSNFEHRARENRYRVFDMEVKIREGLVVTGHHLDDSFEWSLMQQVKSSKIKSILGIPFRRGSVYRPFLCVNRSHISKFVKDLDISFLEDLSNQNLTFERNFIRHQVIRPLKLKYPKFLKHYARRQNDLARKLGVSVFSEGHFHFKEGTFTGGIWVKNLEGKNNFDSQKERVVEIIEELSSKERGKIRGQVEKFLKSVSFGKRGPFSFSGGVSAYMAQGAIVFLNSNGRDWYERRDKELCDVYAHSQIPVGFKIDFFPFLQLVKKKKGLSSKRGQKGPYPLLFLFTSAIIAKGDCYEFEGHLQ